MTATEELLPCPFCGGKAKLEEFDHLNYRNGEYVHEWAFWHECPSIGACCRGKRSTAYGYKWRYV